MIEVLLGVVILLLLIVLLLISLVYSDTSAIRAKVDPPKATFRSYNNRYDQPVGPSRY